MDKTTVDSDRVRWFELPLCMFGAVFFMLLTLLYAFFMWVSNGYFLRRDRLNVFRNARVWRGSFSLCRCDFPQPVRTSEGLFCSGCGLLLIREFESKPDVRLTQVVHRTEGEL